MREMGYRAWLKGEMKMVEVKTIHFGTRKIMYGYSAGVQNYGNASCGFDDCEIMQFTGLRDKNGVKVYEGDIVRVYTDCEYYVEKGYHNGVIIFDDEYFFDYQVSFEHIHNSCSDYLGNHRDDIEVVGNVYDNPELIKESE